MKTATATAMIFCALVACANGESVSWRDIGGKVKIVGRLGVPIGSVVEIEATIVSGSMLAAARHDNRLTGGTRFLRVEAVDGVACEDKPVMRFTVAPGPMEPLTIDPQTGRLTETEPRRLLLEEAPLGTTLILHAFESAATPQNPSDDSKDLGFQFLQEPAEPDLRANPHFRTTLHVVEPHSSAPVTINNSE